MLEQSFFYNLFLSFASKFSHFYKQSLVGRFLGKISIFFSRLWHQSLLYKFFFGTSPFERGLERGVLGRLFNKGSREGAKSSKFFNPHLNKSRVLGFFSTLCESLLHVSLRSFGVLLFLAAAIPTASSFIAYGYAPLFFMAICGLGFVLLFLNRSIAQLYNGSFVLKKALGFFFVSEIKEGEKKHYLPLFAVLGLALGAVGHFGDMMLFIMAFGGLFGGILVLYRVEIGIFATAFFIPLLPTMLILGLIGLTTASFIIHLFFTGRVSIKFNYVDAFVLLFAGLAALGIFISYVPASTIPAAMIYILYIIFYFVVKNTMNTKGKLFSLVSILMLSGFLVAAFGIWQNLTDNFTMTQAWIDEDFFGSNVSRIYSTLENPNVLGGYLIAITILAFAMMYMHKSFFQKVVSLGVFGTAALCMLFTHSRGAWLGLMIAFAIFALMRDRRLLWLGVVALLAAPFIISPEVLQRFLSIGDMADTSTSYRVSIWLGAFDMLRVFWPIGIGQGVENFNFIYNLYAFNAVHTQHSHNLYLQIMIYFGIGGIITFLLYTAGFFKATFKALKNGDKAIKALAAALAAAMGGLLLKGMTDNIWYNFRILAFFWVIVAIGVALANVNTKENTNENQI